MNSRGLAGMAGVFLLVVVSELNDNVTSTALVDVRGQLGIGYDPGTWLDSLYVSALVIGMSLSPWWFVTLTLRRFALGVCALCCCVSTLIPFTSNIAALDALRLLQGFSEGLAIPVLMPTALRVLPLSARLYGLALYGLTSTGIPNLATGIAALWTDVVGWQFIFFQALPLCAVAATLILHGLPPEKPQYERIPRFDWRGALLVIIGFGSLTTLLQQGDRLDWFNSEIICVLALAIVVAIPLLVINEWRHELPLFRLRLLRRRNIAYGVIALFTFLIICLSSSTIPLTFLQEIQGYRPLQSYLVTVEIAASQLVLLPAAALLLDVEWIDARYVAFSGLVSWIRNSLDQRSHGYRVSSTS